MEEEEDTFGLDQFAAKIHLGKPPGSAHNYELEQLRNQILHESKTRDEAHMAKYFAELLETRAEMFERLEVRGRLVWLLIRSYGLRLPLDQMRERLWCAQQLCQTWSHGERAGYLWGVLLDAVNKSALNDESEALWKLILEMMDKRKEEFEHDRVYLWTARLAGVVDAFRYDLAEPILVQLSAAAGPDLAAWAFTRCLAKSLLMHQPVISKLPMWNGKEISCLKLRAAHISPLLADVGCIEAARNIWIRDHSELYKDDAPVPETQAEARLEMEHLRAGLLVFARYPKLEAPHDTILALIMDRFESVLQKHPHLCIHNHGLLFSLARAGFYELCNRLSQIFLSHGSSRNIIGAAMVPMCVRNGDTNGFKYWSKIKSPAKGERNTLAHIDAFNLWALKAASSPISKLITKDLPRSQRVPFYQLAMADSFVRRRYFSPSSSEVSPSNSTAAVEEESTESTPSEAELISPSVTAPNPPLKLEAISEADYRLWLDWLDRISRDTHGVSMQDLHSFQKVILLLTVPGHFEEAENVILAPFRRSGSAQDIGVAFLLGFYTENHMYSELIKFTQTVVKVKQTKSLDKVIGSSKLIAIFTRLQELQAPPFVSLQLWNLIETGDHALSLIRPITSAIIAYKSVGDAEELAEQLLKSHRGRTRSKEALPFAKQLAEFLTKRKRGIIAAKLVKWIESVQRLHAARSESAL